MKLKIRYTYFDTSIGTLYVGAIDEKIVKISISEGDGAEFFQWIEKHFENSDIYEDIGEDYPLNEARHQLMQYFRGMRDYFDLPLLITGTDFQKRVYIEMQKIPWGKTLSYEELAKNAGSPGGARAAGGACRENPLPIVIPCHRVIGKDGSMTGFGGGIPVKEKLLETEKRHNG